MTDNELFLYKYSRLICDTSESTINGQKITEQKSTYHRDSKEYQQNSNLE
jgi:hypothetical protein